MLIDDDRGASALRTAPHPDYNPRMGSTALEITPTLSIPDDELVERFVRASGAGGQNVNKVSSAVHLRFDIQASSLPPFYKERLLALRDSRITQGGVLVLKAQQHRTQEMNRADALARLNEVVNSVAVPPRVRRATKPSYGSKQRRLEGKSQRSETKSLRGKVQCIYFDPPYGINFNRNFQWSTTSRAVQAGNAQHREDCAAGGQQCRAS